MSNALKTAIQGQIHFKAGKFEAPFVKPLVASLLLVAMPGAPSSVLAPSSKARSPL